MDNLCNDIRNEVFSYADSHGFTFYDLREQHGLLRDMVIRNSNTGEWMLIFQFHYDEEGDAQRAHELMQHIADNFPQISSLFYVDNQKGNDTFNDLELTLFKGTDHIYEVMEDLRFKVGLKASTRPIPSRLTTSIVWHAVLQDLQATRWSTTSTQVRVPLPILWHVRPRKSSA